MKKISVRQLKPGMYIADLGSEWMAHSFLRNRFAVRKESDIAAIIAAGIREVYIDPSRGLDVADAPTANEVRAEIEQQMFQAAAGAAPAAKVSAQDEIERARRINREAQRVVHSVMADVRLGRQVRLEEIEPAVERITDSILRNGGALLSLGRLKTKDDYTFQHSVSVCALLVAFCRAQGMDGTMLRMAGIGGLLHDIGKVRVDDAILNKPGRLSEDEFAAMQRHTLEGGRILEQTPGIDPLAVQVAYQHHERHDGSGYPAGLSGDGISPLGQMAAICDVYDAITSDRVYHRGEAPHEALRKIFEWSKYHFNPQLTHAFLRTIGIYPVGTLVMLESGRIGVVLEQSEKSLLEPLVRVFFDAKRRHYLAPEEVNLAKPFGQGGGDRIVGHETAAKWGIDLSRFF